MAGEMFVLPFHTRRKSGCEFRPAHEYAIMFKLAEGDYYHVPAAQVQQICPELQTTVDQAVQDGTAMTHVFEVPRFLEQEWKDWWTVNDYIVQGKSHTCNTNQHPSMLESGCELTTYEPISSFLTDAHVYILATHRGLHAGAEAAVAATQDRAAEILDCLTDTESLFVPRAALFHLESLVAAARLACGACEGEWEQQQQQLSVATAAAKEEESMEIDGGGSGNGDDMGYLRAMVVAACATLGPLLAELPALRHAVAEDAGFAELWERVSGGGFAPSWFTPEVRERMQDVLESRKCEIMCGVGPVSMEE